MPLTFSGTYTQNDGDEIAVGTVTVTHVDGTTDTATLDGDGAYTLELDTSDGTVTIIETFDGLPVNTYSTGATDGSTTDTSRDLGRVALSAAVGATGATGPVGPTGPAGSYTPPDPLPVIPASPTAADVAAVLVALGLATQGV